MRRWSRFALRLAVLAGLAGGSSLPLNSDEAATVFQSDELSADANRGDPIAQCKLAVRYESTGSDDGRSQAFMWFQKSAEQGFAPAQYELANFYFLGRGVPPDASVGLSYLQKAAYQQFGDAELALGEYYSNGRDAPVNFMQAVFWYFHADRHNFPVARYRIGRLVASGVDVAKAFRGGAAGWYKPAAVLGHAQAQYELALLYEAGLGVTRDRTEAFRWFAAAALNGVEEAGLKAALLAADGVAASSTDLVHSYVWLEQSLGSLDGDARTEALTARDRLSKRMTPAQLAAAQSQLSNGTLAKPAEPPVDRCPPVPIIPPLVWTIER